MSRIQNSSEVGGWDVWVTPAGGDPADTGADEFIGTARTLAEACVMLLEGIAQEEKKALAKAADEIAKLEDKFGQRTFDVALIEALVRRRGGNA